MSDVIEDRTLQAVFKGVVFTLPTTPLKVALYSTATDDAAGGTEVTGGSYARQTVTFGTYTAGSGSILNDIAVTFTNMPAVTVTHMAIWDSTATPVRLWHGPTGSIAVAAGNTLTFPVGSINPTAA